MKSEDVFPKEYDDERGYSVEIKCQNCGFEKWYHNIPVGEEVENYLASEKCIKCGCKIIREKIEK